MAALAPFRFSVPSTSTALVPNVPVPVRVTEATSAIWVCPLKPLLAALTAKLPPLIFRVPAPVKPPATVDDPPAVRLRVPPVKSRPPPLVSRPLVNTPPLPNVTVPVLVTAPTVWR